jgi:hypothetical protein
MNSYQNENISWIKGYINKLGLRNQRMPGFSFKFIFLKASKSFFLLPFSLLNKFFFCKKTYNTIIYRPDKRHYNLITNFKNTIVIGDKFDRKWANSIGYDFYHFYIFYSFSNLGSTLIWKYFIKKTQPKRILLWSDYALDQYLAIHVAHRNLMKVWCFQHGLFPFENHNDLDGLDADINVVSSTLQSNIMRNAGFYGKLVVQKKLFSPTHFSVLNLSDLKIWRISGKPIVFIGPGYSHDKKLESNILFIITKLHKALDGFANIVYRPHPRDKDILKELKKLDYVFIDKKSSSYYDQKNIIFIGVKSTYLIEAQNSGKIVFLIKSGLIPQYFEQGEIENVIDLDLIKLLPEQIKNKFKSINPFENSY